ncbi:MAG: hypothetical protein AAGU19_00270 [Prolixibacteraceae bacterium]
MGKYRVEFDRSQNLGKGDPSLIYRCSFADRWVRNARVLLIKVVTEQIRMRFLKR